MPTANKTIFLNKENIDLLFEVLTTEHGVGPQGPQGDVRLVLREKLLRAGIDRAVDIEFTPDELSQAIRVVIMAGGRTTSRTKAQLLARLLATIRD